MYMRSGDYLGKYSNNEDIYPLDGRRDFGLDAYESEFFTNPIDWTAAGPYQIALKFDVDDFDQDIFYFCHVSVPQLIFLFTKHILITKDPSIHGWKD